MLLREPGQTQFDINFSFLGFPCRVHPAFFILPAIFSQGLINSTGINAGIGLLIMVVIFFISVLIHEVGHTLAFRYFGIDSHIVLYWMGGLAIPGRGGMTSWSGGRTRSLRPNEQIIVSLAGPVAGLLLGLVFTLIAFAMTFDPELENFGFGLAWWGPFPMPTYTVAGSLLEDRVPLQMFIRSGIAINIILNLFNLLPIYPLDGGQISRQIFIKTDPWAGIQKSVILSLCVSIFVAICALKFGDKFMAFFFGYMAYENYQLLSQGGNTRRPW